MSRRIIPAAVTALCLCLCACGRKEEKTPQEPVVKEEVIAEGR